jgi:DeoR family transcriptional regulator, carbon catabolite repression regulator
MGREMLKDIRQQQIYDIIKQKKVVTIDYLTKICYSSQATIRRDLVNLEISGLIRRIHGGATLLESKSIEPAQSVREQENADKKIIIANLAIDFLGNNQSVFIDSSTTNRYLIPLLKKYSGMTYITNSFKSAQALVEVTDADVYLCGGKMVRSTNSLGGNIACEFMDRWHTDIAIMSCRGASSEYGATVVNVDQSDIKQKMIQNAKCSILLCDSSKFEKSFLCKFSDFSNFSVFICDKRPPESLLNAIERYGCEVLFP